MKIRTGDIYRIDMPKYKWVNQFVNGKVLDLTCGKYLNYAASKLLLKNNVDEVWSLDFFDIQQYTTLRKLDKDEITYQIKNKKELDVLKFDTILAFNILSITDNVNETLKFISKHLAPTGVAIISIANNDNLPDHPTDLDTKDLNLFSKNNFENMLKSFFNNITFFSQGTITFNDKKEMSVRIKLRIKIKDFFLGSNNRFNFYSKYLRFIHKPIAKVNRNQENKNTQRYEIISFQEESQPMFTIAKCKK